MTSCSAAKEIPLGGGHRNPCGFYYLFPFEQLHGHFAEVIYNASTRFVHQPEGMSAVRSADPLRLLHVAEAQR